MPVRFEQMRLLVIEDQPETRRMMRSMLMELGFAHVAEAENGRHGLDAVLNAVDPVDAVLCDWNLPLLNGVDVVRRMRQHHLKIPFLMVTGRADAHSVAEAKDAGVNAYIYKPFTMNQLEAKLRVLYCKTILTPSPIGRGTG